MSQHAGTEARYSAGCRCDECRAARSAYIRRRDLLAATGRSLTVPAAQASKHLRNLRAAGGGWNQITAATGCSSDTISGIISGRRTTIRRTTANRILGLRLADVVCERRPVASLGSIRRVQALIAVGHRVIDIIDAAGVDRTTMSYLLSARVSTVRAETHRRIAEAFDRLSMAPGQSARSIRRAQVNQWAPPLAWDDPDDPAEQPNYGATGSRVQAVVEDTAELARLGLGREAIAERLGLTWSSISRTHHRAGMQLPELAA